MNPLTSLNRISWKYIIPANLVIVLGSVTVTSLKPLSQTTYNAPKAAANHLPPPLTKIVINPASPPKLIDPTMSWGKVGDAIIVKGENLGDKPFGIVKIGSTTVPNDNLIDWQPTFIAFEIPIGASTDLISIQIPSQNLTLKTKTPLIIKQAK